MVTRRLAAAAGASALGLLVGWGLWSVFADASSPEHLRPVSVLENLPAVPRIGLWRLDAEAEARPQGERDLFAFGRAAAGPTPQPGPTPGGRPTPRPVPPRSTSSVGRLAPAILDVRYVGSVERPDGLKVAVLISNDDVVLTGREGDLVANRLKIVKIGFESVDVQDLGSERVRRIPLKAR